MIYQLKNGQIIHISLEEYLTLTDEELDWLSRANTGSGVESSMLYNRASYREKNRKYSVDIDYDLESDDVQSNEPLDINNIIDEATEL